MIRDAIDKVSKLPLAAKIGIASVATIALGCAAYLLFGPTGAAATAIGGVATIWGMLSPASPVDDAADLAKHNRERLEREAANIRRETELAARNRAKARREDAERIARLAGASDDGDPGRVLDRHSRKPWRRRGD